MRRLYYGFLVPLKLIMNSSTRYQFSSSVKNKNKIEFATKKSDFCVGKYIIGFLWRWYQSCTNRTHNQLIVLIIAVFSKKRHFLLFSLIRKYHTDNSSIASDSASATLKTYKISFSMQESHVFIYLKILNKVFGAKPEGLPVSSWNLFEYTRMTLLIILIPIFAISSCSLAPQVISRFLRRSAPERHHVIVSIL